jgi:hypothetical protein
MTRRKLNDGGRYHETVVGQVARATDVRVGCDAVGIGADSAPAPTQSSIAASSFTAPTISRSSAAQRRTAVSDIPPKVVFMKMPSGKVLRASAFFNHPITVSIIGKISCETGKFARSLCNFNVRHASVARRGRFCFALVLITPVGGRRAMRVAPISAISPSKQAVGNPTPSPDDAAANGLTPQVLPFFQTLIGERIHAECE